MKHRIFGLLLLLIMIPAVVAAGIMLLWNSFVPEVFGFANVTYWQALGMFLLCQLLCGGFVIGLIGLAAVGHRHRHHNEFRDRWHNMSREERRDFINRRMGFRGAPFGGPDSRFDAGMNAKQTDGGEG